MLKDYQLKINMKSVFLTNAKMQTLNDSIRDLSSTILQEVERLIEEDLILELRKNLPKMFTVLNSLAKLDITLAFVELISGSSVAYSRPNPIDPTKLSNHSASFRVYIKQNSPLFFMKQGVNPIIAFHRKEQSPVTNDVFLD